MDTIIPKAIDDYCAAHSAPPSALRQELADYTLRHCAQPQMLVGALEAALLQMLIRMSGARRVLEIGLYTGYSALAMAEALPDDGEITSCDINPQTSAIAQSFFDRSPHGRKIAVRLGPALTTLMTLSADRPFDFAFLDADKENYPAYYEALLPRLRPGGLLVADNALWSGRVLDPKEKTDHALVTFNQGVRVDPRVENVLLPVRDGVMLVRKR